MKVKNIAFSGFAGLILATGAARAVDAVPQIASTSYVDRMDAQIENKIETLNTTLSENYTTNEDLDDVILSNINDALGKDDSEISQALAGKESVLNKATLINDTNVNSDTAFPTVGAVTLYTQQAIGAAINDGIDIEIAANSITTSKIADRNVTAEKLSAELNDKINAAQTANDVAGAITAAVSDQDGAIQKALSDKVDEGQVNDLMRAYTLPIPDLDCTAASGRCVLSVDTAGKLTWVNVTATTGGTNQD